MKKKGLTIIVLLLLLLPLIVFIVVRQQYNQNYAETGAQQRTLAAQSATTFTDDFDGSALSSTWSVIPYGLGQACLVKDAMHTQVSNGTLILTATKTNTGSCAWTSGGIQSLGKFSQHFGRFEMRAKLPADSSAWPAFWLLPDDNSYDGEIDILETLGGDKENVGGTLLDGNKHGAFTLHMPAGGPGPQKRCAITPDYSSDYHTYTLDWTSAGMTMSIDGKQCATFTGVSSTGTNPPAFPATFNKPYHILVNLAVAPNGWGLAPPPNNTITMYVDYIKVWKEGGASGTTPIPSPTDITPTLYCLGSCPTLPPTTPTRGTTPSVSQAPTVSGGVTPTTGGTEPTVTPCTSNATSEATGHKKHKKSHGGFFSRFIEWLLKIFQWLFEKLGIQLPVNPGAPTPTPQPGVTPDPTQPSPTVSPCPSPSTSTAPSTEPSISTAPITSTAPTVSSAPSVTVTQPPADLSSRLFTGDFEPGNFSQWQESQSSGSWSQQIVQSPKRQGKYAARFEIRDGDCPDTNGTCYGERSERGAGATQTGGQEGDERWYQWSTQFGTPFPNSHSWGVISQWHAQTDGSPPISFNVDGAGAGKWGLQLHKQSAPAQYIGVYTPWSAPLANGTWHDIKIHIKWSISDSIGFIELWHNGVKQTFTGAPCAGQTKCMVRTLTPGGGGTYFKQGYYRDQGVSGTGVIFHDGFTAAKTEAGLGPLQ